MTGTYLLVSFVRCGVSAQDGVAIKDVISKYLFPVGLVRYCVPGAGGGFYSDVISYLPVSFVGCGVPGTGWGVAIRMKIPLCL